MMFEVPLTYSHLPRGFRGMGDLCDDPEAGWVECTSDIPGTDTTTDTSSTPVACPSGEYNDPVSGLCLLYPVTAPTSTPATSATPAAAAGSTMTAAQLAALISGSGQAASSLIKATSSPYVIPGTNVIYNPATGQIAGSSSAVTASVLGSNLMPFLIVGAAVVMIIMISKK